MHVRLLIIIRANGDKLTLKYIYDMKMISFDDVNSETHSETSSATMDHQLLIKCDQDQWLLSV